MCGPSGVKSSRPRLRPRLKTAKKDMACAAVRPMPAMASRRKGLGPQRRTRRCVDAPGAALARCGRAQRKAIVAAAGTRHRLERWRCTAACAPPAIKSWRTPVRFVLLAVGFGVLFAAQARAEDGQRHSFIGAQP